MHKAHFTKEKINNFPYKAEHGKGLTANMFIEVEVQKIFSIFQTLINHKLRLSIGDRKIGEMRLLPFKRK